MHPAIKVHNLSVIRSGRQVLDDLSFEVKEGEIVGLFGPSGSGKTTLMRSIIGLQKISSGYVHILGHRRGTLRARSLIGYMSQNQGYYIDLTADQNLDYFSKIVGAPGSQKDQLIEELRLAPYRHQLVGNMSGGQQARVSLATALLGNPRLLVLDEPTGGLDPVLRKGLWQYFKTLKESKISFLVSSHDLSEANYCDHVILIRDGRLLAVDRPAHLTEKVGARTMEEAFIKLVEGEQ